MDETLPKSARLSGQLSVAALFEHGKGLSHGCLRCKYIVRSGDPVILGSPSVILSSPSVILSDSEGSISRIVVSVPKRLFKRAVKRNLLKRRIRESFRRQKGLLTGSFDILFIYSSPEVLPYEVIFADMGALLDAVSQKAGAQLADN